MLIVSLSRARVHILSLLRKRRSSAALDRAWADKRRVTNLRVGTIAGGMAFNSVSTSTLKGTGEKLSMFLCLFFIIIFSVNPGNFDCVRRNSHWEG